MVPDCVKNGLTNGLFCVMMAHNNKTMPNDKGKFMPTFSLIVVLLISLLLIVIKEPLPAGRT
jgi:hypothetical protein